MSQSPCSVPEWLRVLIPLESDAAQNVCRVHDDDYLCGGTRRERLRRDAKYLLNLLDTDMDPDDCERYFWGVRLYGGSHWNGNDAPGQMPPVPPRQDEAP